MIVDNRRLRDLTALASTLFLLAIAPAATARPAAQPTPPAVNHNIRFAEPSALDAFYARWQGPAWFGDEGRPAAELARILRRAPLDGLASGPALASQVEQAAHAARSGSTAAAERILSAAWITYVEAIRQPTRDMIYGYPTLAPKPGDTTEILSNATAAPSLAQHLAEVSALNPVYADLRDTAWREWQAAGGAQPDRRIVANLERLRSLPATGRFALVNIATQRLEMYENGRPVDSMKVIVGSTQYPTPMIASVIYYATVNPYWNVPPHLVRKTIAPNVLKQGQGYLKSRGYQVMADWTADADVIPSSQIDWKNAASGAVDIRVRQLPGPGNSMGKLKFSFANGHDIYLHDTPEKHLFARSGRDLSNGCVRLEDAARFGRWLLGREPVAPSAQPEQFVQLPRGVPIYLTYQTAQQSAGKIAYVADVYGLDPAIPAGTMASAN